MSLNSGFRLSVASPLTLAGEGSATEWVDLVQSWQTWKPPSMLCRLGDFLVTTSAQWHRFRAQLEEHFSDDLLPANMSEPADWKWLSEHSHYIVTFHVEQIFLSAGTEAQYLVRRLAALSRCLREFDDCDYGNIGPELRVGGFKLSANVDHPARCRYIAVPLAAVDLTELNAGIVGGSGEAEKGEFDLPIAPFYRPDEIIELEQSGLVNAWAWLTEDGSPYADRVRRALDSFEAANSILRAHRTVPTDIDEAWSLTALRASLEALFPVGRDEKFKSGEICDQLTECLKRLNCGADEITRTLDVVSHAFRQRNALLHGSRIDSASFCAEACMRAVSTALRETIQRCARTHVRR